MRVVFFGDSLTEGVDGASYLRVLHEYVAGDARLRGVELVNAGIGGDTVINLARRLDRDVIPAAPDWVVIFTGVNDLTTWYARRTLPTPFSLGLLRYFRDVKGIHGAVTPARYRHGVRALVDRLRAETTTRVALCTPVARGEWLGSRSSHAVDRYADIVREAAAERGCALIDLRAAFVRAVSSQAKPSLGERLLALPGTLPARLTRPTPPFDFEELARRRGYLWTYDGVHLTHLGATLVAGVMRDWLLDVVAEAAPVAHTAGD